MQGYIVESTIIVIDELITLVIIRIWCIGGCIIFIAVAIRIVVVSILITASPDDLAGL